jgi:V/A-type H+-transporting ATPase subunit I
MFPEGFGAFFTEGFFELFDVVLTFITNTMSFLRVGGFVLSHAGMMLVVYTLAGMVGGIGYWIVLVLGNAFVMCLEGLIVGIQVLRLEFYEMFSRYYEGNGKPFVSMKEILQKD